MIARQTPGASLSRRSSGAIQPSEGGWTLIEMMIVLSLIMILTSMAMTTYRNSVQAAREGVLMSDLTRMREAIDQYFTDKAKYPDSLQALVSDQYIRAVPVDPITKSSDSWQTVPAEATPNGSAPTGIYDVKSGADGTALDGTRYADW
jgi:general secretion pathway protein G